MVGDKSCHGVYSGDGGALPGRGVGGVRGMGDGILQASGRNPLGAKIRTRWCGVGCFGVSRASNKNPIC